MKINELVKQYRLKANMTQLELSKRLGLQSMQFVHLMEAGKSPVPLKTLGKLIVILGLPEQKIKKQLENEYKEEVTSKIKLGKNSLT